MGMQEDLLNELSQAFDTDLSDAVNEFTGYREGEQGAYDPIADEYTNQPPVNYTGRGVFSNFDIRLIDEAKVLSTDKQLLILQNEVTEEPKIGDLIDDQYRVHNKTMDPVSATYRLHLRQH